MPKKKQIQKTGIRFDSNHVRLRQGESQRPNNTYVYRWTGTDGKRHAVYAPTLEELREQEEQVIVDKHDGIKVTAKNYTVNDLFDLWSQLKRGIKDSTFKNYVYMYNMFVRPKFGQKKATTITKSDVRRFYNHLIDDKILKIDTLETIHNVLSQMFSVAVEDGMMRQNPTEKLLKELKQTHDYTRGHKKALTKVQQQIFFDYMLKNPKYTHWYPVFFIMGNTGMRVGEITGLRWCDIDLEEGFINVDHTLVYYNHLDGKGCSYSMNTPKTESGKRSIPMIQEVKEAFLMEKKFQEESGIESVDRVDIYDDFIFVNRSGKVQNSANLNKALQRIIRDCNNEILETQGIDAHPVLLPPFSCHILRHTCATRLCESGMNVKVIQAILGHADIETTMNIYIDVTNDLKKQEIAAFGKYLATGERKVSLSQE